MKLKALVTLVTFSLFIIGLISSPSLGQGIARPQLVSLIRVIANPNDFNGKTIRVIGFLAPGLGADKEHGLFVSEADGRNFLVPNSIDLWEDVPKVKDLMFRYVVLTGTYHAPDPRVGYNGYIDHIADMRAWSTGNASK